VIVLLTEKAEAASKESTALPDGERVPTEGPGIVDEGKAFPKEVLVPSKQGRFEQANAVLLTGEALPVTGKATALLGEEALLCDDDSEPWRALVLSGTAVSLLERKLAPERKV